MPTSVNTNRSDTRFICHYFGHNPNLAVWDGLNSEWYNTMEEWLVGEFNFLASLDKTV